MADRDAAVTATIDPQAEPAAPPPQDRDIRDGGHDRTFSVLGVEITDVTGQGALGLLEAMIRQVDGRTRSVFFVNAHTLNLAAADPYYRQVLNSADRVFGDGTGVRWAARLQGVRISDNVNGTDLTPELFRVTAGRGYGYFLLGADPESIQRAAKHAERAFPGWVQVGFHHGYLNSPQQTAEVVDRINRARPHVLLVGMGNPIQERWIHDRKHQLNVPLCMAVGGLFSYWAGNIRRAPRWLRSTGMEWLGILFQQPAKARRYLLGNPLFLLRVFRELWLRRRRRRPR